MTWDPDFACLMERTNFSFLACNPEDGVDDSLSCLGLTLWHGSGTEVSSFAIVVLTESVRGGNGGRDGMSYSDLGECFSLLAII